MKLRRRIAFLEGSKLRDLALQLQQGLAPGGMGVQRRICSAKIPNGVCPLWIKSGHFATFDRCLLYPRKRTSPSTIVMSRFVPKAEVARRKRGNSLLRGQD